MTRYVVQMSQRKAAAYMTVNVVVFVGLLTTAVVGAVRTPDFGLLPSGWVFVSLWATIVVVIFVRNAVICARRRYTVWRFPWQGPPPGGQRVR